MYRDRLVFATHPNDGLEGPALDGYFEELSEIRRVSALFRATPRYTAPFDFRGVIRRMIGSGAYKVLA